MLLPILYSFRRCPYAIRARLALTHAQVPLEIREVLLRHKPPAMLAISPKGTVPVLQLPDGQVIDESLDIMKWALQQADTPASHALIARNDGPFKALLDRRLTESPCLLGNQPGLADMAIAPFIRQFAQVDADWFASAPFPALRIWLNRFIDSPLFVSVMAKYPAWQAGDAPIHLIDGPGVYAGQRQAPAPQAADSAP